jgi:ketosteroid isomerase-like protein
LYTPGQRLKVFDVPPRQYIGADAYRKDWQAFVSMFAGPVKFDISDLAITADGELAYSHSIQHVSGSDTKNKPFDLVVRVTDVYRKTNGKWLIVHEHVSVRLISKRSNQTSLRSRRAAGPKASAGL